MIASGVGLQLAKSPSWTRFSSSTIRVSKLPRTGSMPLAACPCVASKFLTVWRWSSKNVETCWPDGRTISLSFMGYVSFQLVKWKFVHQQWALCNISEHFHCPRFRRVIKRSGSVMGKTLEITDTQRSRISIPQTKSHTLSKATRSFFPIFTDPG